MDGRETAGCCIHAGEDAVMLPFRSSLAEYPLGNPGDFDSFPTFKLLFSIYNSAIFLRNVAEFSSSKNESLFDPLDLPMLATELKLLFPANPLEPH